VRGRLLFFTEKKKVLKGLLFYYGSFFLVLIQKKWFLREVVRSLLRGCRLVLGRGEHVKRRGGGGGQSLLSSPRSYFGDGVDRFHGKNCPSSSLRVSGRVLLAGEGDSFFWGEAVIT